jgi:hypothetical protein
MPKGYCLNTLIFQAYFMSFIPYLGLTKRQNGVYYMVKDGGSENAIKIQFHRNQTYALN